VWWLGACTYVAVVLAPGEGTPVRRMHGWFKCAQLAGALEQQGTAADRSGARRGRTSPCSLLARPSAQLVARAQIGAGRESHLFRASRVVDRRTVRRGPRDVRAGRHGHGQLVET